MKFEELKDFLYSDVTLIIGNEVLTPYSIRDITRFDDFEVIGIRSNYNPQSNTCYIVISLKEPLYKTPGVEVDLGPISEKTFGTVYECKDNN